MKKQLEEIYKLAMKKGDLSIALSVVSIKAQLEQVKMQTKGK